MKKKIAILCALLLLAGLLTSLKIPVASSQGLTLVAAQIAEPLPIEDVNSPLWKQATALQVPLSAQTVTRPMLLETNVKGVTARALYNDQQIAILVEWADNTDNSEMVRVQDFRDAVAVQFPLVEGQPFVCMGQQGVNVNIWHWKADWQKDLAGWQDMNSLYPNMNVDYYPFAKGANPAPADYTDANYVPAYEEGNLMAVPHASSVENLVAGGFGTLTSQPIDAQNVHGYGIWDNNTWRVIFSRNLTSGNGEDAQLAQGKLYPVAFAAWDGANNERNGQKSTSEWVSLQIGQVAAEVTSPVSAIVAPLPSSAIIAIVIGIFVAPFILLIVIRTVMGKDDQPAQ